MRLVSICFDPIQFRRITEFFLGSSLTKIGLSLFLYVCIRLFFVMKTSYIFCERQLKSVIHAEI